MSHFEWKDDLSVGVNEMDNQHKQLIGYINDLVDQIEAGNDILPAFDKMSAFVVKHFDEEEQLMEANQFEGLGPHKLIHQQLLKRVGEFRELIVNNELDNDKLIAFLRMWLTSHIKGIDTKYGQSFGSLPKAA
ncbi:bacteriohemerythrin [Bacteriovorax sp. DB6_IX]|uniref:bacteriohemerythrin n=1 Tax=Bacteriovorax sp. DB6_IX TaxID=1353530 RepID=UPI00038A436A|nr:bacteriohemerythrin [Bacteriovorax sp. DB6_IX]EQC48405.1 hemerythrin family non-heme iron protein [Bacteriovorax sp. DB6_IX]